jgi:hypothetical protein
MSPDEARLWALEAKLERLPTMLDQAALRVRAAEERQQVLWALGNGAPANNLAVTVQDDTTLAPLAGATVDLADTSGNILQAATADGAGIARFTAAPGSYNIGAWFADYDSTYSTNTSFVTGFNVTGGAQSLTLALHKITNRFCYPPFINRTLVDPTYGTMALVFSSIGGIYADGTQDVTWEASQLVNYSACGSPACGAASNVPATWTLHREQSFGDGPRMFVTWTGVPGSGCPAASGGIFQFNTSTGSLDHGSPMQFPPTKPPGGGNNPGLFWCSATTPLVVS